MSFAYQSVNAVTVVGCFAGFQAGKDGFVFCVGCDGATLASFLACVFVVADRPAAALAKARGAAGRLEGLEAIFGVAVGAFVVVELVALFFDELHADVDAFGELVFFDAGGVGATPCRAWFVAVVGGSTGPSFTDQAAEAVGPAQSTITDIALFAVGFGFAFFAVFHVAAGFEFVAVIALGLFAFGAGLGFAVEAFGALAVAHTGDNALVGDALGGSAYGVFSGAVFVALAAFEACSTCAALLTVGGIAYAVVGAALAFAVDALGLLFFLAVVVARATGLAFSVDAVFATTVVLGGAGAFGLGAAGKACPRDHPQREAADQHQVSKGSYFSIQHAFSCDLEGFQTHEFFIQDLSFWKKADWSRLFWVYMK